MTKVILLEKIDKLGGMGDVVEVKPGYARNFLLPQNKALRATDSNIAYFERQKVALEKANEEKKKLASKLAKKLENLKVPMIRQASESGQLYGSVTSRDISEVVSEVSGEKIARSMVAINRNYKMIGLFPVDIVLHPEVKVEVTINIARSEEEAKIQEKTGKALIAEDDEDDREDSSIAGNKEAFLEESALEAERRRAEEAKEQAAAEAKEAEAKQQQEAAEEGTAEENAASNG